ncbi:Hypothetical predicted protein [Olea europaea subsp. europaea]|uniref:Uncharacterized protein n=1 Tax=Olea europaea subsp. europaea TaxID=158383 RepID=A0A8S0RSK5_OLEEU|nr:Hypothetical predicted protein [Olea europaea subsp. europaea]
MTRSRSEKLEERIGIHESGRRGKRKVNEVQKDSSSKRRKSERSVTKSPAKKLEMCDLEPPPVEMTMPYMTEMWYEKPVPPNRSHGEKRKDTVMRTLTMMTLLTHHPVGRGHKSMKILQVGSAAKVEKSFDSKGQAKVDSACTVEFLCSIEPPSFDLGLGFTQPSQFVAKKSKEVEVQVDSVISNVLKETTCIEQEASKNLCIC